MIAVAVIVLLLIVAGLYLTMGGNRGAAPDIEPPQITNDPYASQYQDAPAQKSPNEPPPPTGSIPAAP
jgi:hypothetical protein